MKNKLPHLQRLLQYRNDEVILRYCKDFNRPKKFANRCFTELLKFFWLSHKATLTKTDVRMAMYPEMLKIDEMWHVFLLYTKEYHRFSEEYFGGYIHHQPANKNDRMGKKEFKDEFQKFLNYTYDHLGSDSLRFWFKELV